MTPFVVLLGAVMGFGGLLLFLAWRGVDPSEIRPQRDAIRRERPKRDIDRLPLRIALAVMAGTIIGVLTQWPVAALLVGGGAFMLPSIVGGRAQLEREMATIEAVASWAEMLRDTMAAAGGLEQSIIASAGVAPPALRRDVAALAVRLERERLNVALREFAQRVDDPTCDLVVAALLLAADKSPKRLGELLGMLAEAARAEVNMRLRVEAGRARSRTSVRVVSISTAVFALGLIVLNRGYLEPYDSLLGQAVLGFVGACFVTSFYWLGKSGRYETVDRFLAMDQVE